MQSESHITEFLDALTPFRLTLAEQLQLVDLRPSTPVELQLVIEETEERFTDEQLEELLQLVGVYLPNPQTDQVEEEVEEDKKN